jgi:hypothetical protein
VTPDLTKIIIVVAFLAVLLLARQIILTKSGVIKDKLGVGTKHLVLIDSYKLERSTQLSLFEIAGQRVVVLQGKGGQAGLLQLSDGANDVSTLALEGGHHD